MDAHDFTAMAVHAMLSREEEDAYYKELEQKRKSELNA